MSLVEPVETWRGTEPFPETVLLRRKHTYIMQRSHMYGGASAVKNFVGHGFDRLVTMFSKILMLLMWLTLPGRNEASTQDVENLATDLNLGTITKKFSGCTTGTDVILQCVDKLLVSFHTIHIGDQ